MAQTGTPDATPIADTPVAEATEAPKEFATPEAAGPLILIEHADSDEVIDLGEMNDSVGDLLVFSNPVYDESDTEQVGSSQGSCIQTEVGVAWECSFTIILDGGQIMVSGPFRDTGESTIAVIGGTGGYGGASGEMIIRQFGDETGKYELEITLF